MNPFEKNHFPSSPLLSTTLKQNLKQLCDEYNYHPSLIYHLHILIEDNIETRKANTKPEQQVLILLEIFTETKKILKDLGSYSMRKKELEKLLENFLLEIPFELTGDLNQDIIHQACKEFPQVESLKTAKQQQSQSHTDRSETDMIGWLNTWMVRPHFASYKKFYEQLNNEQDKAFLTGHLIDDLNKQIGYRPIRRTLFQILSFHQRYEQGVVLWSSAPCDPLNISMEEQHFFKLTIQHRPDLIVPLYIQWIERLIEKRTKKHYEMAIIYLTDLQPIMNTMPDNIQFHSFLQLLYKKYKGYSSLQKELKKFEKRTGKAT